MLEYFHNRIADVYARRRYELAVIESMMAENGERLREWEALRSAPCPLCPLCPPRPVATP